MTLQRAQIDVLLEDLEATAWRRHRADPCDPTLSRDVVAQARALLRTAPLDEHLYICDCTQHLLLRLVGEAEGGTIPDLGIPLVDDPFDLDAYVPCEARGSAEPVAAPMPVRMLPGPEAVRVLAQGPAPSPVASASPRLPLPAGAGADAERRRGDGGAGGRELRRGLTTQQLHTLDTMAHFGWTLRFVRRPLFQPPVPVAFDRNRERFVVIAPDGTIDDAPDLRIRR